jgi:hypothetical protein
MENKIINDLFGKDGMLLEINETDLNSVPYNPTILAQKFLNYSKQYMEYLPHCFWSGKEAKEKSKELLKFKSDADISYISLLFKYIGENKTIKNNKQISFLISKLFALYSKGPEVIISLSSDKKSEIPGLTVSTNLWEAELPIINYLYQIGEIKKINFMIFSYSIHSMTYNKIISFQKLNIPIYRRYYHIYDHINSKNSFILDTYDQTDFDNWRKTPNRKGININIIRKMIKKWRNKRNIKEKLIF